MNLPSGLNLDISIPCENWEKSLPDYETIIQKSIEVIASHIPEGKNLDKFSYIDLSVVLCNDNHIQSLNRDFRNQDKATNVLSFEGLDETDHESYLCDGKKAPEMPFSLGEVYISHETMVREANDANISLKSHFYHLTIHGLLHLLGYDHMNDDEAGIMEGNESDLLKKLGIDDPYAA